MNDTVLNNTYKGHCIFMGECAEAWLCKYLSRRGGRQLPPIMCFIKNYLLNPESQHMTADHQCLRSPTFTVVSRMFHFCAGGNDVYSIKYILSLSLKTNVWNMDC